MWATLTVEGDFDIHEDKMQSAPTLEQMQAVVDGRANEEES